MSEFPYDPSLDIFLNAAAVLFLTGRLRRFREARVSGLWFFGAGALGIGVSLFALLRAAAAFHAISPRDAFLEDAWDSLLFLQIVFGSILLVSLFAVALGLPPVRRRASQRFDRWLLALPVSIAAVAGWLGLSNAAPLVDSYGGAWLLLLGLTLALTFAAVRLTARWTGRWSDRPRAVARFGCLAAAGAFLLAARLAPLVAAAVWNTDILQPLLTILSSVLFGLGVVSWLRGGEAPGVVVFLRRFGKTDLNRALARAARGRRRGARFRMVTLDDQNFVPQSGERSLVLTGALGVAAVVVLIAVTAYALLTSFEELFGYAEERLGGVALAVALTWLFAAALVCLLPVLIFLGQAFWRSRVNRRTSIASRDDVKRLSGALSRSTARWQRARSLSRPRALVATTAHEHWQEAVLELLKVADLVFLDLSDLSENVHWELDRLREQFPAKAVILVPEGTQVPARPDAISGPEPRVVVYRSYPDLEKALHELMAKEALVPVPALSGQEAA